MEAPVSKPKICHLFLNVSIKAAQRLSMPHRGVALGWHWQRKWWKHTEDGFGSKAKSRRERLYDLSCASRNQWKRHNGCPPRRCLGGFVVPISFRWMRGMVACPAIFTSLLCGGCGRGKIPPSIGKKAGCARSEMRRAQFLRSCLFYSRAVGAL